MSNNNNKNNKRTTQKTPDKFVITSYSKNAGADIKTSKNLIEKKTNVIRSKKLTLSSRSWLLRQMNDPFVAMAKDSGYRSRASFKLLEINDKFKIIKTAKTILDLGCAPGSWTQVCKNLNNQAKIVACDLLEIDPLHGVDFICGDFTNDEIQEQILKNHQSFDLIISDIAPNTTGNFETDHIRIIQICESVLEFSKKFLSDGGNLVMKIFMGNQEKEFIANLKPNFKKISYFKPKSSRADSKEIYLICANFKV